MTATQTQGNAGGIAQPANAKQNRVKVKTPVGRLVYPRIYTPDNLDSKYKCIIAWVKGTDLSELKKATAKVAQDTWPGVSLKEIQFPFVDGDTLDLSKKPWAANQILLTAKTKIKPGLAGPIVKEKLPEEFTLESGAWGRLSVTFNPYVTNEQVRENGVKRTVEVKGVNAYLNAVQYVRPGERIGGGGDGTSDFDDGTVFDEGDLGFPDSATNGSVDDDDIPF